MTLVSLSRPSLISRLPATQCRPCQGGQLLHGLIMITLTPNEMSYLDYLITYEIESIDRQLSRIDRLSDRFDGRNKIFDLNARLSLLKGIQDKLITEYLTYPLKITQ